MRVEQEAEVKMKRMVILAAALALVATFPVSSQSVERELDALVDTWVDALSTGDIDAFMSCYWDDAIRIMYGTESTQLDEGARRIRDAQQELFDQRGSEPMQFPYDPIVRLIPDGARPTYFLPNSAWSYMDVFEFERRVGEYRIIKQYVLPHPPAE